jgi:gamma-glutamylcyclotransferase (GGCT)/AIG2-like uncharacterized protein YtfP
VTHVFTYGSLMIPAVMRAVTGRDFLSIPAFLRDHARYRVRGESYPGIIQEKGSMTPGILYFDLDHDALKRLDDFEGAWYERTPVRTETGEGKILKAETYLFQPGCRGLLTKDPWDLETFEKKHLRTFMKNYKGFYH